MERIFGRARHRIRQLQITIPCARIIPAQTKRKRRRAARVHRLKAWALNTGERARWSSGYIGYGWADYTWTPPDWCAGNRICLFATRVIARRYLKKVRGPSIEGRFPRARVLRVEVTIREVFYGRSSRNHSIAGGRAGVRSR